MRILIDDRIVDSSGKQIGKVKRVVNDSWTGELRALFLQAEDVASLIRIDVSEIDTAEDGVVRLNHEIFLDEGS